MIQVAVSHLHVR